MSKNQKIETLLLECENLYRVWGESIQAAEDLDAVEQIYTSHCLALKRLLNSLSDEIQLLRDVIVREETRDRILRRLLAVNKQCSIGVVAIDRSQGLIRKSLTALPERSRAVFALNRLLEWLELEEKIILTGDLFMAHIFDVTKVWPLAIVANEEHRTLKDRVSERWVSRILSDMEKCMARAERLRNSTSERFGNFSLLASISSFASKPFRLQ